ncbi:MAG: efflux RND transporter periplasmic adaptor subunit [Microcoleaceae cyanobacterium]
MKTIPQNQTNNSNVTDSKSFESNSPTNSQQANSQLHPEPHSPLPNKLKRWAIALLATGLLTIPMAIYFVRNHSQTQPQVIETLTVPVEAKNLTIRINASGEVQPVQRVNISPKTQGRLAELFVEQGDHVQKGQIVARMESREIEAQLMQALARLANTRAKLAQLKAGNRVEEISASIARLNQAQARLAQLKAGSRPEEISASIARLNQTKARLTQLQAGSRVEEIAQGKARLEQAIVRLKDATSGSLKDEIAQAEARIEATKAEEELTAQRVKRYQNLREQGAIASDTYEEYVRDDRRVRANLREAEKRLKQLKQGRRSEMQRLTAAAEQERQALKQLENGTRPEEIARAEAEVAEARSQLEELENGTRPEEIARAEAEVAEARSQLEELENGTRPEEIAQAEAEVAEVRSQLEELENGTRPEEIAGAEAEVAEALGQVRYQQVQVEDTKVTAPFAGIITQRYATEGAFVTPATSASDASSASSTSIVALARGLEVLAKVPEADIAQIKPGQKVEIVADAYPDMVFKGDVKLVAPEAVRERDVTLFEVRIDLETGKDKLQSGMNVDLEFLGNQLQNALVVPTVAIITNKGETGVLITDAQNQPRFKSVIIGSTIGNQVQILEGIRSGQRVFVSLPEGKKLEDFVKN